MNKVSAADELSKVIEYIERNANKINHGTYDMYKQQILGHIEDAKYYLSQLSSPVESDVEKMAEELYPVLMKNNEGGGMFDYYEWDDNKELRSAFITGYNLGKQSQSKIV